MDRKNKPGTHSPQSDLARLQGSARELDRWLTAQQHVINGRFAHAAATYHDLVKRFPGVAQLWFELGIAAIGDLDFSEANGALVQAAALAPNDSSLLILIGQQCHRLRQLDRARTYFEQAVAADPNLVFARVSLADWYERDRKLDAAWEQIEACLAKNPRDEQARYFQAFLLHRQNKNLEAETALRDLIAGSPRDPNVKVSSRHLLGVVLDQLGQYAEAMKWLVEAKTQLRQTRDVTPLEREYEKAERQRRELVNSLQPAMIERWRKEIPVSPPSQQLALLGGHPRSGTTLLEQILGAHPDVLAFDESEAFVTEIANQLAPVQSPKALTADALNNADGVRLGMLRRRYLKSLLREVEGEPTAKILVDKNPSATSSLHLFLRTFHHLKVIIALRDPRDTIISCFFQNLQLTSANVNFLTLDGAARHYTDMMDIWLRLRELGGFEWIETRYEDMVNNLEVEGRRVTEFLGLTWDARQMRYHESAGKKFVFAPTYSEVTKPVYTRAVNRWENYASALEPLQERLGKYCKQFGYGR